MRNSNLRPFLAATFAMTAAVFLTSCGTTPTRTATRSLPEFEPPMAKADFGTVRTTAYTHSEDDHLAYGAHNALGGVLQSATVPAGSYRSIPRALPVTTFIQTESLTFAVLTREQKAKAAKVESKKTVKKAKLAHARKPEPPRIGSAAADWSRWPVGTTFRIVSTGQTYRVDDYGWALAGRNTIDLYMASTHEMNAWGVRNEPIQVLHWGDPEQSLALLQTRQRFKHCRRMALELQGLNDEAAALH